MGISQPANGTSFAPAATCASYRGVRFSVPASTRRTLAGARLLDPLLDPEQHPALHQEVRQLEEYDVVSPVERIDVPLAAADDPASSPAERLDRERSPALEGDLATGLKSLHREPVQWMEHHLLAHLPVLPLRMDPVGVAHPAAGEVFEPLIAVEATAVLAELGEPGPDLLGRGVDLDRMDGRHGRGR